MVSKKLHIVLIILILLVGFSCKKKYPFPEIKNIPEGELITIAKAKEYYEPGKTIKFTKDISVTGVITADETNGNLYKECFLQDSTGGLYLRFISSSGVYIGDSVRVNLKGANILKYNQMLQIDSLHPDNNIVKIKTQQYRKPETVTIAQLNANKIAYQGKLVKIENVFFLEGGKGKTFADASNKESLTQILQDVLSNTLNVRTSGYAKFAADTLPLGSGSIIGIVSQYNSDLQLIIRSTSEIEMNKPIPIIKDFQDQNLISGGWSNYNVSGILVWSVTDAGSTGNFYCKIDNTVSKLTGETWFISPPIDLSNSSNPFFSFRTATFSSNGALRVYALTNYVGGDPNLASLTQFTPTLSQGSWMWTSSGNISLSAFLQNNTRIAFRYVGYSTSWNTWEIDDIIINP